MTIKASLPDHDRVERFDIKKGVKGIDGQRYKNNACLAFPIHKYWLELKTRRGQFKKAKNPIQEVLKLFQNSGFGVLACLYLATNNLMSSNQITAGARSGAWLMTNALNGFGSITDGTSYSWEHLPLNKTFSEILATNPSYLEHFDNTIQSGIEITQDFKFQKWIDANLKQHMASFYGVDADTDYNLTQFEYELKTENFLTKDGQQWITDNANSIDQLKNELGVSWETFLNDSQITVETPLFTKFYNNNAGNYCKGIEQGDYLVNGAEYDLVDNKPFIKARSFQGSDNALIDWYCKAIGDKYTEPLIYQETKLIKFGDGNLLAIKFLESGSEHIAHPMGFDIVAYKMMKLVTRSQFLFQSETQLRNFETNEESLTNLSKDLGLNQKIFWDKLTNEDIMQYGIEKRENVDYFDYSKTHPVGVGFELLALAPTVKGDINQVRRKIIELIDKGCKDFNAGLSINKYIKYAIPLKNLFAAVIVAKKNAEDDLREILENSADEPTRLSVRSENIKRLHELLNNCAEDE